MGPSIPSPYALKTSGAAIEARIPARVRVYSRLPDMNTRLNELRSVGIIDAEDGYKLSESGVQLRRVATRR